MYTSHRKSKISSENKRPIYNTTCAMKIKNNENKSNKRLALSQILKFSVHNQPLKIKYKHIQV